MFAAEGPAQPPAGLRRVRPTDAACNVAVGLAHLVDAKDCVVWSEDGPTVVYGLENGRPLVLPAAHDALTAKLPSKRRGR